MGPYESDSGPAAQRWQGSCTLPAFMPWPRSPASRTVIPLPFPKAESSCERRSKGCTAVARTKGIPLIYEDAVRTASTLGWAESQPTVLPCCSRIRVGGERTGPVRQPTVLHQVGTRMREIIAVAGDTPWGPAGRHKGSTQPPEADYRVRFGTGAANHEPPGTCLRASHRRSTMLLAMTPRSAPATVKARCT